MIKWAVFASVAIWLSPVSARPRPGIDLSLKGGPNTASLSRDLRVDRYGLSGGLAGRLRRPFGQLLSLSGQVEILYSPRGAEVVSEGAYVGKVRQHYLDVMVVARPEVRIGPVDGYLLLGGGLNLLLSANQEDASGMELDLTDVHNRLDVALLVGAGVAFRLPPGELGPFRLGTVFLEARYDRGLIDTLDVEGGSKNRTASLMLGLSVALTSRAAVARPASLPARGAPTAPAAVAVSREPLEGSFMVRSAAPR